MVYPAVILMLASCLRNDYEILDPATAGTWTLYTTADGLPSDQVSDIQTDSQGNLWVSFPGYGAAKFDNNHWTYFRAAASPLLNDGVNCVAETADGRVVFGTIDGLSILASNNVWSSFVDPADGM
ncbi:MAG TPA: two-component regulator propeller domain-containing protein, partial [Bacteroidales bacterium]|nr:two-component regulator propeller domain-containing protein [Bacteroidales bacterium]